MNCFHEYIGIKSCNSPENASGLFITQLPGLTLKGIEKIAEKEQVNFMGVWKDVQDRAALRLARDFKIAIRRCFDLPDDYDTDQLMCNDQANFADVWLYILGYELMMEKIYSSRLNFYTTIDKDNAEVLRDMYLGRYEECLKAAVAVVKIEEDDEIVNSPTISYRESLP